MCLFVRMRERSWLTVLVLVVRNGAFCHVQVDKRGATGSCRNEEVVGNVSEEGRRSFLGNFFSVW